MTDVTVEQMLAQVENPVTGSGEDYFAEIASVFDLDSGTAAKVAGTEPSVGTLGGEGAGGQTPAPEPAAPAAQPTDGQAPAAQPTADPAAAGTPPAAAAPAAQPVEPDKAALELADLKAKLARLEAAAQPAAEPAKTPDGKAAPEGEGIQPYAVQLPQVVLDQLLGEDPAQSANAMNVIISSVLTHAHTIAAKLVSELRAEIQQNVVAPQQQSEVEKQNAAMREDYYKHFPTHNQPQFAAIIAQQAAELSAEFPNLAWGDDMRNALGARVTRTLTAMGVKLDGAPAPAGQTPSTETATPAAFLPTGTRPASTENAGDIIMDTLSI